MKLNLIIVFGFVLTSCGGDSSYKNTKREYANSVPQAAVEISFALPDAASISEAGVTHYSVETTPRGCTYGGKAVTTRQVESEGKGFLFPNCDQTVVITLGTISGGTKNTGDVVPEPKVPEPKADFQFTYLANIKPYVDATCAAAGCHGGAQPPLLTTYAAVKASAARVNARIQAGTMPIGGLPQADASQKAMFAQWVKDGSPEQNAAPLAFELAGSVYTDTIEPFLQTNCIKCHGSGSQRDFSTKEKVLAKGAAMIKRMESNQSGFAMPPPAGGISADDIAAFKSWLASAQQAGTPSSESVPNDAIVETVSFRAVYSVTAAQAVIGGLRAALIFTAEK